MAPQLGMGTFRISHVGYPPMPWDSYATSDGNTTEVWALHVPGFMKPDAANPNVQLYISYVGPPVPDICAYIASLNLDPAMYEIWRHNKARGACD